VEAASLEALAERLPQEIEGGWRVFLAWNGETLLGFMALSPADGCLHQLFVAPQARTTASGANFSPWPRPC